MLRDPTFWIAAYGAVVATWVAFLHWGAHRRDRGSLELKGHVWYIPGARPDSPPRFSVHVVNVGRRVVQVREFGLVRDGALVPVESTVSAGDPRLREADFKAIGIDNDEKIHTADTCYVRDTVGRVWKMPRREFRRFRRQMQQEDEEHRRRVSQQRVKELTERVTDQDEEGAR